MLDIAAYSEKCSSYDQAGESIDRPDAQLKRETTDFTMYNSWICKINKR